MKGKGRKKERKKERRRERGVGEVCLLFVACVQRREGKGNELCLCLCIMCVICCMIEGADGTKVCV